MKKHIMFLFCFLLSLALYSQDPQDPFEAFRQQANQDFSLFSEEVNKQWDDYERASQEAFENFKKEIESKWGEGNFVMSSQKDWVEYNEDKTVRSLVDFETEEAKLELLLTPDEVTNAALVQQKLAEAVKELATNKGKTKDYSIEFEAPEPLSLEPVLKGQLQTAAGEPVTEQNVEDYAEAVAETAVVETEIVKGTDEVERVVVSIRLPLAPNSIQTRAEKFYDLIQQYAATYQLEPAVVFAIIHTESYYNPKARSHVPAFGLMQIVPRSAGRDVYQFLHGEDKLVSENYLYDPQKNIEMGAAYVHILMMRSFRRVADPECRLLCAVAAYNTGAGNVSRAFIGTTKLGEAIPEINKLNFSQLYEFLREKLPYQETRDYIQKITSRMESYQKWMEN
jgi:membrane-bound lytic murein transglycosylase C